MKLSAQLYTVRDFTKTQEDIEKTLKKVKEIGYNSIQVSAFGSYDPYWLADKTKELGLEICTSHTPLERIINDTDNVIKEHKAWGCKYIGYGGHPIYAIETCNEFLDSIEKAVNKIAESGMLFLYHNHDRELVKPFNGSDKTYLDYMGERYSKDLMGYLIDFYWTEFAGFTVEEVLKRYKDRMQIVHYKDMKISENGEKSITEVGNGVMDYKNIHDALLNTDVEVAAVEQDSNWTVDPFTSLKTSYDNLRKIIKFDN